MTRTEPDHDEPPPIGESGHDDVRAALRAAWSELLGVAEVRSSTNFYSAGGTSIGAALLLAKMHGKGSGATLAELIARPTFAEQLELFTVDRAHAADPREVRLNTTQELRLAQLARQVRAGETTSLKPMPFVLEIAGAIDRHLLVRSMIELVRQHEMLHTGFLDAHGEIAPRRTTMAQTWQPVEFDLSALTPNQARGEVWRLIGEAADQGLAFDVTPLILGAVVTVRPDLTFAVLVIDHLVCDGESLGILCEDLVAIYAAQAEGRQYEPPEPSAPTRGAGTDRYSAENWPILAAKWRDLVDGYSAPPAFDLLGEIDTRDFRSTVPSPGRPTRFVVPAETVAKLKVTYRRLGLPPVAIMLAATYLSAHILSGAPDICVINPRSRRNRADEVRDFNDFAEPAVVRITHQGSSCPCDVPLAEVAAMAAASYSRTSELEMPIDVIRPFSDDTLTSTARSMIGSTLRAVAQQGAGGAAPVAGERFDDELLPWLWCNYNRTESGSRSLGGAVATWLVDSPVSPVQPVPNVMIYLYDDGDEIQVEILVPEKLYDEQLMSELGSTLARVLDQFAENPDQRVSASGSTCAARGVGQGRGM